jgi:hypothetical protein
LADLCGAKPLAYASAGSRIVKSCNDAAYRIDGSNLTTYTRDSENSRAFSHARAVPGRNEKMTPACRKTSLLLVAIWFSIGASSWAQRAQAVAQTPHSARAIAPADLTGYWVSVVTEDWRWRMFTPPKGDYAGLPLNAEGRKIADGWDPAKDEAAGEACRSYGAGNIMRVPGRIRISWRDDETLRIETDAGSQTRLIYFGAPKGSGGDWQGISQGSWDRYPAGRSLALSGSLKVITTRFRPGYLRKNGVPYSGSAILTEYFDRVNESNGAVYLVVTSALEDPTYLSEPFLTTVHFRRQADASGWNPTPCSAR